MSMEVNELFPYAIAQENFINLLFSEKTSPNIYSTSIYIKMYKT